MTVQPTRDQLRAHLRRLIAAWDGPGNPSVSTADLAQLLDQLDQAEARIKAVEDVLAHHPYGGPDQEDAIRRVLEG